MVDYLEQDGVDWGTKLQVLQGVEYSFEAAAQLVFPIALTLELVVVPVVVPIASPHIWPENNAEVSILVSVTFDLEAALSTTVIKLLTLSNVTVLVSPPNAGAALIG